jgi:hypothetical protein
MKYFLLITEYATHDDIDIVAAGSLKEAAEQCLSEEQDLDRIIMLDLLTGPAFEAVNAMPAVIEVAFALWRDSGSENTDADLAPYFLKKHCMDLVEGEVELCLLAAEEDTDHIRQESSNLRIL